MVLREIGWDELWASEVEIRKMLSPIEKLGLERYFIKCLNTLGYVHGTSYEDLCMEEGSIILPDCPKYSSAFYKGVLKKWDELVDCSFSVKQVSLTNSGKIMAKCIIHSDTQQAMWEWCELLI